MLDSTVVRDLVHPPRVEPTDRVVATTVRRPQTEAERWDADVAALGGSLLQSWRWGAFKAGQGWEVARVRVETRTGLGLAQILFRRYGLFSLGYLPRGPVLSGDQETALALFEAVDAACAQRRAVSLIVEPDRPLPFAGESRPLGFVRGPRPFQPARTVKIPLLDDAALLAQMRRDTRANVRRAARDGVEIERAAPTEATVARFYDLLQETSTRNAFGVHEPAYYTELLRHYGDDALVAFARVGGEDAVGLIAVRQGAEAVYLYGGSSARHRVRGAAQMAQVEAMRWAREGGCHRYDLWGIPAANPPAEDLATGHVARTRGDCWDGLYQFKTGFGGEIVGYPETLERRYHPLLGFLARRLSPRYRTAPPTGR
jgi:lipid II:glycine glycyltransferase (peptidoglycan interpeptide bridge formation enzyme)